MKKNYIISGTILAFGVLLLLFASICGVSSVKASKHISISGDNYRIRSDTTLNIFGAFRIKEAKIIYKVYDKQGSLLDEKIRFVNKQDSQFFVTYTVNDIEGIPDRLEVEVVEAKFNNVFFIVLSIIIIIGSVITFLVLRKKLIVKKV